MITLIIPSQVNEDGEIIPGGTFGWFRGLEGEHSLEGNWQTLCTVGGLPANTVVHINLQKDLTRLAKARGLDDGYGFVRHIPKPTKEKKERTPKDPSEKIRRPTPGLMGGFNPFNKLAKS